MLYEFGGIEGDEVLPEYEVQPSIVVRQEFIKSVMICMEPAFEPFHTSDGTWISETEFAVHDWKFLAMGPIYSIVKTCAEKVVKLLH